MSKAKEEKPDFNLQMKELEKKYSMKPASEIIIEPKILTGIYALDFCLDGGVAQCEGGHKIELFGKESSGKTTMAMRIVSKFQELNKTCIWVNAENNLDKIWAEMNGVDTETLLVTKPTTLEEAGDCILDLVGKVDLIVIDSISMLLPAEELEDSLEDKHYASQAKVNSPFCRKLNQAYKDSQTVIIFINQVREKIGQMFGNPETTAGGRALKHLYDSRLQVRPGKPIDVGTKEQKERIGHEICIKNIKNKKGKAYRTAIVDFYSEGRFDNRKSLLFAGIKYNIIQFSGKTYQYKELKAVGQEAFKALLTDKVLAEIEKEVWKVAK